MGTGAALAGPRAELSFVTEPLAPGVLPLAGNVFMVQPAVPAYVDVN